MKEINYYPFKIFTYVKKIDAYYLIRSNERFAYICVAYNHTCKKQNKIMFALRVS